MKRQKVISRKNLPVKPPLVLSVVVFLVLDGLQANPVYWGIAGTLLFLLWVGWAVTAFFQEDTVDIFKEGQQ